MFWDKLFRNIGKRKPKKAEANDASGGRVEIDPNEIDGMDLDELFDMQGFGEPQSAEDGEEGKEAGEEEKQGQDVKAEADQKENWEESSEESSEDSSDIDQEIEALLAQDALMETKQIDFDHVQNVEIHEHRENYDSYVHDTKPKGKISEKMSAMLEGVPMRTMYILAGVMALLIVILAAAGILLSALENKNREKALQNKSLLTQPAYVSNNANFIYLNRLARFREEDLVLVKMLIDPIATVFCFQQNLDVANLDFILEDENGALYGMDLTYAEYGQEGQEDGAIVRFEPLDLSVLNYVLTVSSGDQSCQFPFTLEKGMTMPPVKYLTDTQEPLVNASGLFLKVLGGTLSSSGSIVNFKLQWDDPSMTVQMGGSGRDATDADTMGMMENGRSVLPVRSRPLLYEFDEDNGVLGRMDFQAVKSLSGTLRITFKNLYKKFQVNAELPTQGLFANTLEGQQIYTVGEYNVVLERMGWQGDSIVLVFHAEDRSIFAKSGENVEGRYAGRVECKLNAQLVVKTDSGMEVTLEGQSTSGQKGTDMHFNTGMAKSFIGSQDNIILKINSILIKMDPVSAEYDLDSVRSRPDTISAKALTAIEDAFKSRLAYKSGEITAADITGFTNEVLADERLMAHYVNVKGAESPSYTAQFVTYSISESGNEMQGIVRELWKATADGRETHFYRTHRVWAEINDMGWCVVRDEIIT